MRREVAAEHSRLKLDIRMLSILDKVLEGEGGVTGRWTETCDGSGNRFFSSRFLRNTNMSLKRYSKAIDGTIPIQALLYDDEELQASQEGVGIYDG